MWGRLSTGTVPYPSGAVVDAKSPAPWSVPHSTDSPRWNDLGLTLIITSLAMAEFLGGIICSLLNNLVILDRISADERYRWIVVYRASQAMY